MNAHVTDGLVRLGSEGRERFYDSRGYGQPVDGELLLSRVEAAHLLSRGDLDAVDGVGFREFLATASRGFTARFVVYAELRSRGFYLTPARDGWVDRPDGVDFVVYPRGHGPWDDAVEYRIRVVAERDSILATDLGDVVLAVVDEESELTYFETTVPTFDGSSTADVAGTADAALLDDSVLVWEPPAGLHERAFYGQPFGDGALQLSLVEAAHLAATGTLRFDGGREAVLACGHAVEGEQFDRRLAAYTALRARGVVPKTGFKFGADFRTYADVDAVDDLGHSERLVRVVPTDHAFSPRDLSLDVRLAHGVRKEMVVALTDGNGDEAAVRWRALRRLTP